MKQTRTGNLRRVCEAATPALVVLPAVVLAQPDAPLWPLWAGAAMVAVGLLARLWLRCHLAAATSRAAWPDAALRRATNGTPACGPRRRTSRDARQGAFGRARMTPPAA